MISFSQHITWSIALFLSLVSTAQDLDNTLITQLKSSYSDIKQPVEPGGKRISFIDTDSLYNETGVDLIQVMIIRHQKVNLPKQRNYTYREANRYYKAYDTTAIFPVEYCPVHLRKHEIDKLYCSQLLRTKSTARQMFGPKIPLEKHAFFNEFKKDIVPLPVVRFNLGTWSVLSSIEWMLGAGNGQGETYKQARTRAGYAAEFLDRKALDENKVVLIAHGFLNHFIRRYMKKNGWHLVVDGRHHNLGVSLLVKERK